jgi:hypothetical protein
MFFLSGDWRPADPGTLGLAPPIPGTHLKLYIADHRAAQHENPCFLSQSEHSAQPFNWNAADFAASRRESGSQSTEFSMAVSKTQQEQNGPGAPLKRLTLQTTNNKALYLQNAHGISDGIKVALNPISV